MEDKTFESWLHIYAVMFKSIDGETKPSLLYFNFPTYLSSQTVIKLISVWFCWRPNHCWRPIFSLCFCSFSRKCHEIPFITPWSRLYFSTSCLSKLTVLPGDMSHPLRERHFSSRQNKCTWASMHCCNHYWNNNHY